MDGYDDFLRELKERIYSSQITAVLSVNRELVLLYWQIGREILTRQQQQGWGAKVIERLAKDLKAAFPDRSGFSARNLKYMRTFAEAYPNEKFVQLVAAQIPWFHNCIILDKIKNNLEREWYVQKTIENGWSRNILNLQIQSNLYNRQGKAITNFNVTLSSPQSDIARETLKDPYIFDFLTLGEKAIEREVEKEIIKHITKFLLELGVGFAFVGQQYPLKVSEEEFYIDLLFYHIKLHCFVVIELKTGKFKPEYTGKINFYLSAVDDLLKSSLDNPSIGLILCASKDNVIAEYALRDVNKPIGIAEWQAELTKSLPKELQAKLPTIEQLEAELEEVSVEIEDEE
jgi:predicted nuclease of restriction endonuclease-like (RecB) superfamily